MKIGLITCSLARLSFDELLPTLAEIGLDCVEFGCGPWSPVPHVNVDELLESESARREFKAKLADHGLEISALNAAGNQLHPRHGKADAAAVRKTMRLANLLGLDRVVMMSGLPGSCSSDEYPNWATTVWPPDNFEILKYQWEEVAIPYWRELAAYARDLGITRIAVENHPGQLVYNVDTILRLREVAGDNVGLNLDPSHIFWMGGDPLQTMQALGQVIFHVHAKDTRIETNTANTMIDMTPFSEFRKRSWNYVTLGYGHSEAWWVKFVVGLRMAGYDDVLSIEHEDFMVDPLEGVTKAAALLKRVALRLPPSYVDDRS
jgi:sugar phosphate isomerase/epimerase